MKKTKTPKAAAKLHDQHRDRPTQCSLRLREMEGGIEKKVDVTSQENPIEVDIDKPAENRLASIPNTQVSSKSHETDPNDPTTPSTSVGIKALIKANFLPKA